MRFPTLGRYDMQRERITDIIVRAMIQTEEPLSLELSEVMSEAIHYKDNARILITELERETAFLESEWKRNGSRLVCGQWHAYATILARAKELYMEEFE